MSSASGVEPTRLPTGPRLTRSARKHRIHWNLISDWWQSIHEEDLHGDRAYAWSSWRISEASLGLLSDVRGLETLELGCGAAQFSIALARRGAKAYALDVSSRQLLHARRLLERERVSVTLIESAAEHIPLDPQSIDLVVSDFGALTYSDPAITLPEVARVLRPGGSLVFSTGGRVAIACYDDALSRIDTCFHKDYFGPYEIELPGQTWFFPTYSQWIRLFRDNDFVAEQLLELQPSPGAPSNYRSEAETSWAVRWPMEIVWKVRKPS